MKLTKEEKEPQEENVKHETVKYETVKHDTEDVKESKCKKNSMKTSLRHTAHVSFDLIHSRGLRQFEFSNGCRVIAMFFANINKK